MFDALSIVLYGKVSSSTQELGIVLRYLKRCKKKKTVEYESEPCF